MPFNALDYFVALHLVVRDQEVEGSNPFAPTTFLFPLLHLRICDANVLYNFCRTGLHNLLRHKRDQRTLLHEEVLALQFAVLHAAPGIHAVCLNRDVQNGCRNVRRGECRS
jgi:hypothetical protein